MQISIVAQARNLAHQAHSGQYRRDGITPYIVHPEAVAARIVDDPTAQAVAWLHDTLEDTDLTENALRAAGLGDDVVSTVRLLTRDPSQPYEDYLAAIKAHPIAKKVKIADMLANLSDHPSDKQIVKYAKGLLFLMA
jgi:(p)ppGpp synthase/HD superfamily hydrolase